MSPLPPIVIRAYKSHQAYEQDSNRQDSNRQDSNRMAQQGYTVAKASCDQPRVGLGRGLLLWAGVHGPQAQGQDPGDLPAHHGRCNGTPALAGRSVRRAHQMGELEGVLEPVQA
jgi:hypothetical protein